MRLALVLVVIGWIGQAASAGEVEQARRLWKVGKYAESLETLDLLSKKPDQPPAVRDAIALGRADALDSTGEPDQAIAALREIAEPKENQPDNPDVWSRLAEIQFSRGDWDGADASARRALKAKPEHLPARWVEARLFEARGDREKAEAASKWFVDYQADHNQELTKDAPGLLVIGQAAEKYIRARFREDELNEELNKVINNVYEAAFGPTPTAGKPPGSKAACSSPAIRRGTPARN